MIGRERVVVFGPGVPGRIRRMRAMPDALRAAASFASGGRATSLVTLIACGFFWTVVASAVAVVGALVSGTIELTLFWVNVISSISGALVNMVLTMAVFHDELGARCTAPLDGAELGAKCTAPLGDGEDPLELWV